MSAVISRITPCNPISGSIEMQPHGWASRSARLTYSLYDAFGQRQLSAIYVARYQYHVIMEVAPRYRQSPQSLRDVFISTAGDAAS
jgi:hypothetical protein